VALGRLLTDPGNAWWDDRATSAVETRDDILRRAFADGYQDLVERLGDRPEAWRWGRLHTATFENATLGSPASPGIIRSLFNRGPFAASGGTSIVNATSYNITRPSPFAVTNVPSMRMIVDLSDLDNMWAVHTTGQSGHPFHANYIDQAEAWRNLEYHRLPFSAEGVQAASDDVLILLP
jgi:penicillin amidase